MQSLINFENELVELVSLEIDKYYKNYSTEEFYKSSKDIVGMFLIFNKTRIMAFHRKKYSIKLPKIMLSDSKLSVMAYYDKMKKEVHLVYRSIENIILSEIIKKRSPKEIVDYVAARILFTLLHEIGHHHYYERYPDKHISFKDISRNLKKITGIVNLEDVVCNKNAESFILGEAKEIIHSEKVADKFALDNLSEFFPNDLKEVHEMDLITFRKNSYISYARFRVKFLVTQVLDFLPLNDRETLQMYYFNLIEDY